MGRAGAARRRGSIVASILLSLIAGVLGAELAARVFRLGPPRYTPRYFEPNGRVPFLMLPKHRFEYEPNARFASVYDPRGDERGYFDDGRVEYRINEHGFRGEAIPIAKPRGGFRLVCLGDSFTFGEGVKEKDTYPERLETLLGEMMPDRSVEVINAGVQAYGTRDEAYLLGLRCAPFEPDVVTLGFFLNDVTDRDETVRLHQAQLDSWRPTGLGRVSRIWEIVQRWRSGRRQQEEFIDVTRRSFESEQWPQCRRILEGMKEYTAEIGARFVVVVFPVMWGLDDDYPFEALHRRIAAACDEAGIERIDLLEVYRGLDPRSLWVHPTDQHPNELAHRLAAERIARYLCASPH